MGENKGFLLTIEWQVVNVVRVLEGEKTQHFTTITVD